MNEWLSMGGYACYVWPAYAVTVGGILFILLHPLVKFRQFLSKVASIRRVENETQY